MAGIEQDHIRPLIDRNSLKDGQKIERGQLCVKANDGAGVGVASDSERYNNIL